MASQGPQHRRTCLIQRLYPSFCSSRLSRLKALRPQVKLLSTVKSGAKSVPSRCEGLSSLQAPCRLGNDADNRHCLWIRWTDSRSRATMFMSRRRRLRGTRQHVRSYTHLVSLLLSFYALSHVLLTDVLDASWFLLRSYPSLGLPPPATLFTPLRAALSSRAHDSPPYHQPKQDRQEDQGQTLEALRFTCLDQACPQSSCS
jgi:hypothetical protein